MEAALILDVVCNIEDRRVYMYGTEKAQADKAWSLARSREEI